MASNGLLNFQGTNKATFVGATSNIALDVVNSSLGIGITGTDPPSSNLYITGNAYVSSDISVGGVLNMGVVNVAARHTLEAVTSLGASTPSTLTLTNTGTSLVASGDVTVDTNTFHVDTTNDRVGVGTSSPVSKLHLVGVGNGSGPRLRFETLNNGVNGNYTPGGTEIGGIQFAADDLTWATQHMSSEIVGIHDSPNYSGALGILTFKTSSTQGSNPTEKMRIRYDGNVGVGSTDPSYNFQVAEKHGLDEDGYWATYHVGTSHPTAGHQTRIYFRDFANADNVSLNVSYLSSGNDASDDRIKTDEVLVENATQTLLKLKPQTYTKDTFEFDELTSEEYSNAATTDGYVFSPTNDRWRKRRFAGRPRKETGLIIQDIWYDAPELRHIIRLADDAEPTKERPNIEDIQQDPDYDALGWGQDASHLMYQQIIPYLVKSNQEIYTELQVEKEKTRALEDKVEALEDHLTRFTVQVTARLASQK